MIRKFQNRLQPKHCLYFSAQITKKGTKRNFSPLKILKSIPRFIKAFILDCEAFAVVAMKTLELRKIFAVNGIFNAESKIILSVRGFSRIATDYRQKQCLSRLKSRHIRREVVLHIHANFLRLSISNRLCALQFSVRLVAIFKERKAFRTQSI